jgi:Cys-rich protein (TIGR01571 family)
MALPVSGSGVPMLGESEVSMNLYHRDSLIATASSQLQTESSQKNAALTKKPGKKVPNLDGTRIPPRASVPYPMIGIADPAENYPHWMAGFCVEPRGDHVTGLLAACLPCVLYGKTEWRIKKFSKGENGYDSAWQSKDGCNEFCWAWVLIRMIFPVCEQAHPSFSTASNDRGVVSFIPVALQRTTVRGMYGISGSTGKDCIISFFCQQCVMAQCDREVRAREGSQFLRTDRRYKKYKHSLENQQPSLHPPMAYISPHREIDTIPGNCQRGTYEMSLTLAQGSTAVGRDEQAGHPPSNRGVDDNPTRSKFINKLRGKRRSKLSSAYLSGGDEDGEELLSPQEPCDYKKPSKLPSTVGDLTVGAKSCQPGSYGTDEATRQKKQQVCSSHELRDCDIINMGSPPSQHILEHCVAIRKSSSGSYHRLEQCTQIYPPQVAGPHRSSSCDGIATGLGDLPDNDENLQHKLSHCESAGSSETVQQHPLDQCKPNTSDTSSTTLAQHGLDSCASMGKKVCKKRHTVSFSENSTEAELQQKISNFRKLHTLTVSEDTYQSKKEQQRIADANSVSEPQLSGVDGKGKAAQHNLIDCVGINTDFAVNHTLAVCETSNLPTSQRPIPSDNYGLAECKLNVPQSKRTLQHDLTSCVDTSAPQPAGNHALGICEELNRSQQPKVTPIHDLEECNPRNSLSIVAQHKLAECVIETKASTPERHALEQCEAFNQSNRSESAAAHVLADCDSKDSHQITMQHTLAECDFDSGISTPELHQPLKCEDISQRKREAPLLVHGLVDLDIVSQRSIQEKTSERDDTKRKLEHTLFECSSNPGSAGDIRYQVDDNMESSRNSIAKPLNHRIASCLTPDSPSSVSNDNKVSHQLPENAQLRNSTEPKSTNQRRKDQVSEVVSLSSVQKGYTSSSTTNSQNRSAWDQASREGKDQKPKTPEPATRNLEKSSPVELSTSVSFDQYLPERPSTVGPGHVKNLDRVRLGVRRTKSDRGHSALSEDEESEYVLGNVNGEDSEPSQGSGLASFFAKFTGKGASR